MTFEEIINKERQKEYFKKLETFLEVEYRTKTIFPPKDEVFTAFKLCAPHGSGAVRKECGNLFPLPAYHDGKPFSYSDLCPRPVSAGHPCGRLPDP